MCRLIFIFLINLFNNHLFLRIMSFILSLFWHIDNKSRIIIILDFHWYAVPWSIYRLAISLELIFRFDSIIFINALIHFVPYFWIFYFQVNWIIIIFILRVFHLINEIFFIEIAKIKSLKSIALVIRAVAFLYMNLKLFIVFK